VLASWYGTLYYQFINMTTIAQNIKKTALGFCLSLLFVSGSLSLCQGQGVAGGGQPGPDLSAITPVQTSAPSLNGWSVSVGAATDISSGASAGMTLMSYEPSFVAPETPVTAGSFSPAISGPEPSTFGLMLAGSAALLRFAWRKRSD
jgi:hypothetical protein